MTDKPKLPEKIDPEDMVGETGGFDTICGEFRYVTGPDYTVESLKLLADKINAILEYLEEKHGK